MTAREEAMILALSVAWGRTPDQVRVHFPAEDGVAAQACATGARASVASQNKPAGGGGILSAQEAVSDIGGYWFGQTETVRDHNGERGAA